MSTYVYMRFLESAPERYDLGIRLLSFGRVGELYESAAEAVVAEAPAAKVLEIGCGTGNLTRALLRRGATVTAIDQNPDMLAIARRKLTEFGDRVQLREMAAVEIGDQFPAESFDAVAGALVLSEMSADEQTYVLEAARRLLRPSGRLVVADEVVPRGLWSRLLHRCLRLPVAVITYAITQTTTWPVTDLAGAIRRGGFEVLEERRMTRGSTSVVVARKK